MSQNSDEQNYEASNSFWEIGNYKWTTKRVEDGHRLCDDLMKLVQERAEIEKSYAKHLKDWSKRWNTAIVKGPEYGTTEAAWLGLLSEADQRCDLHMRIKENLIDEVHSSVKMWQKDHYHKSMMGQLKEKKDIEDMFRKAQKQWTKLYEKVVKTKHDYHSACKVERSAQIQERNAAGDASLSQEQIKKLQDRVSKAKDDVQKCRDKYNQAIHEISANNPKYIEDMSHVFDKAQESEQERLEFFKKMFFASHKCLNLTQDPSLPRIYEELYHTVSNADYEKDLKLWSNKYGVNMSMSWPSFEEYSEEFRSIGGKSKKTEIQQQEIMLINQRPVDYDTAHYNPESRNNKKSAKNAGLVNNGKTYQDRPNSKNIEDNRHSAISGNRAAVPRHAEAYQDDYDADSQSNGVSGDDEEWDSERLVDPNKVGVPVRALYDYDAVEEDELTFKIGDTFEKLEDQDEQGWCTGRKDGQIGLYPGNYVEVID